jgi:hypothetical protein
MLALPGNFAHPTEDLGWGTAHRSLLSAGTTAWAAFEPAPLAAPVNGKCAVAAYSLPPMTRLAKLQLIGPVFLLIGVAGAEAVAFALGYAPGSEALWYLHVNVFGPFRLGDDILGSYVDMAHGQLCLIALPLFLIACSGLYSKQPLVLAIACNLSFLHAVLLAGAGYAYEPMRFTSIVGIAGLMAPQIYLGAGLLGGALLSFAASHIIYVRAIWQEHGCPVNSI